MPAEERVIDALACGSCKGIDRLKRAVEVLGRVIGESGGAAGILYP